MIRCPWRASARPAKAPPDRPQELIRPVPDNKNLILAVVLSALVFIGWSFIAERFLPTANPRSTVVQDGRQQPLPQPGIAPAPATPETLRDRAAVLAASPRVAIETPSLRGSINLAGARLDDLVMVRHRETLAANSPPVRLFSPSGAADAYFAQFGWSGAGAPPADARWTASAPALAPGRPVTLTWANGVGQTYAITLSVDDGYLFTTRQSVTNAANTPVAVRPFGLVSRAGISKDYHKPFIAFLNALHIGPIAVMNNQLHEIDSTKLREDGPQSFTSTGGWLGIVDKYWLAALIPDQRLPVSARFAEAGGRYQTDFAAPTVAVGPGQAAAVTTRLYAGAKEVDRIDAVRDAGVPLFDRAIAWGWFWFLAQPIFRLLDWLFRYTGNFGVAIICLTLIVRTAMFPIAQRQFASMAKMRLLMPKMKELQARFKDDKVKQQQEVMALYAKEKVNPLAGCLPVFLQIPIFFSLYKALFVTIEMRHQPFVGWIKDLSAPDPLTPVNLFGLLPFTPPAFIAIGVLPLLLGVTYYYQQKLNPQPMDEMQAKIFQFMPVVLTFIMAPFAAGLIIYWTTSNLVTIAQQWFLLRRHPMPATPPAAAK